jgi:folate-binding protein YgfZ
VGIAEPLAGGGGRAVAARRDAARVWQALVERGRPLGLRPAGAEVEEILRVEAGLPGPGRELSERYNPLEAELRPFVSFTKGCYTGQEVVARLNTYKKLQRVLRGLRLAGDAVPPPEARVLAGDGAEAGQVTSAVRSPALGAPLALAYIELDRAAAGTRLLVELAPGGPAVEAEVLAPPFVS